MDINNKIITIYKEGVEVDNPTPGLVQIISKEGEEPETLIYGYKIYDGEDWIEYYKTSENEGAEEEISYDENLSGFFSNNEDYIYFYVNHSSESSPPINKVRKWNGDNWEDISSTRIGQILKIAADAEAIADGAIKTYSGDFKNSAAREALAPNPHVGDLFIDTKNQNKLYRYDGNQWEAKDDKRLVGEGDGMKFSMGTNGASVVINNQDGLVITNDYGSCFQATADKIGFYDSDGNPKMSIGSDGNAVFSGTITAAEFEKKGSKLSFGTGEIGVADDGVLHLKNVVIEESCKINGTMEVDLGGSVGGWIIGQNFLGNNSKNDLNANTMGMSPLALGPTYYDDSNNEQKTGAVFWAGGNSNPNFYVDGTGKLYASGATISGESDIDTNGLVNIRSGMFNVILGTSNYLHMRADQYGGMSTMLLNYTPSYSYVNNNNQRISSTNARYNTITVDYLGIMLKATDDQGNLAVTQQTNAGYSELSSIILNAPFIGLRGGGNTTGSDTVSGSINRIVISNKPPAAYGNGMSHILWFRTDNEEDVPTTFKKINVYFK